MTRRFEPTPSARIAAQADRGEHGFIIVAVLWVLAALATFASVYTLYVSNTAIGSRVGGDRMQAEALVSAALELTAFRLLGATDENRPRSGDFEFRLGRANIAVKFLSEGARIDLNQAPKELLAGLFSVFGAKPDDASYYADRIIEWRKKTTGQNGAAGQPAPPTQNGAPAQTNPPIQSSAPAQMGSPDPNQGKEAEAYEDAGLNYGPRQGPFQNIAELRFVMGLPPELVERALPFVTVFNGQAKIDAIKAAPEIIEALPQVDPGIVNAVLQQRDAQDPKTTVAMLGQAGGSVSVEGRKANRVNVAIAFDTGRRINAEAVILLMGNKDTEPYRILEWRDDFDGPF